MMAFSYFRNYENTKIGITIGVFILEILKTYSEYNIIQAQERSLHENQDSSHFISHYFARGLYS